MTRSATTPSATTPSGISPSEISRSETAPRPSIWRYWLAAVAAACALWAALFFLHADPYARHKALATTDYVKAGWIYERLHFDPTPVDIAFIGSSRTMQGVDSAAIEAALNDGAPARAHVVNLALPSLGRDVPFLIGRMLLETKRPKILFVEIDYLDYRNGSPVFAQLAEARDVLDEPLIMNFGLADDLFSVPARNAKLFWRALARGAPRFDPAAYVGPHWDDVYRTTGSNGRLSPPRLESMEKARFNREAADWVSNITRKASQYDDWAWMELSYSEAYVRRLLDLAQASGTKIVLFYSAAVGSPERPYHYDTLSRYGELWSIPADITDDNTLWVNPTHLNYRGAEKFSAWVAQRLRKDQDTGAR